mgnify:CR=1 FL=1
MANRGITDPVLLAAIDKQVVVYYECYAISTVQSSVEVIYRLTNAPQDITFDGQVYKAFGQFISAEEIEENVLFEIPTLNINISGIAPYESGAVASGEAFFKTILKDTTVYIDQPVTIHRVFYDLNWTDLGGFQLFEGNIATATAEHNPEGVTTVQIQVSSHWVNFDRQTGRFTNSNSQQFWFPGDLGYEYSVEVQKEVEWKG